MIRKATKEDIGMIAYMIIKWDAELPPHRRMLDGDVSYAEYAAGLIVTNDKFHTCVLDIDGQVEGGYCLNTAQGVFSPKRYGQLLMWYVSPKHRDGRYGYKMLRHAMDSAKQSGLFWMEVNPWSESRGAHRVLEKLGFKDEVHTHVMRMR